MWSLYEDEKELSPLVFSNGKSQADIVEEVKLAVKEGYKIIFIKGKCGSGKSAIALNLARIFGKTSIVVPIKSLQEQYTTDYTKNKYVLKNQFNLKESEAIKTNDSLRQNEKIKSFESLKIASIVGRSNFKCKYLKENPTDNFFNNLIAEKDSSLLDLFLPDTKKHKNNDDSSCNNLYIPCKIEIKEKNIDLIQSYIKKNSSIKITDFETIHDVRRFSIAPVCPYWSPILPCDLEFKKFKDLKKIDYQGLSNKRFIIYLRQSGCRYYEQYIAYSTADVIIFNTQKYLLETLLDRKPRTELEIIDECDEFLDSLANQEKINLNRLLSSLNSLYLKDKNLNEIKDRLLGLINNIKILVENKNSSEVSHLLGTPIETLIKTIIQNKEFLQEVETDEHSYLYHLDNVSRTFADLINETFYSLEKKDKDVYLNLITTNLEKRFLEILLKNKIIVMMSGTIHSESVLRSVFGVDRFKIIEGETKSQGELIKLKNGYELDCSYSNFKNLKVSRENYLKALSKCISYAKKPILVHVNSYLDLPTKEEKLNYSLNNLITQEELKQEQLDDPFQKRVEDFKLKKTEILFTTKCNRGIDFPGDLCNSIVITRFPYPDISNIFWKILKKNKPNHFMSFYMDKAKRELLQRVYRALRSKYDRVYLLSPDIRVMNFNFE
jgi:Rad3-related DNA helicase